MLALKLRELQDSDSNFVRQLQLARELAASLHVIGKASCSTLGICQDTPLPPPLVVSYYVQRLVDWLTTALTKSSSTPKGSTTNLHVHRPGVRDHGSPQVLPQLHADLWDLLAVLLGCRYASSSTPALYAAISSTISLLGNGRAPQGGAGAVVQSMDDVLRQLTSPKYCSTVRPTVEQLVALLTSCCQALEYCAACGSDTANGLRSAMCGLTVHVMQYCQVFFTSHTNQKKVFLIFTGRLLLPLLRLMDMTGVCMDLVAEAARKLLQHCLFHNNHIQGLVTCCTWKFAEKAGDDAVDTEGHKDGMVEAGSHQVHQEDEGQKDINPELLHNYQWGLFQAIAMILTSGSSRDIASVLANLPQLLRSFCQEFRGFTRRTAADAALHCQVSSKQVDDSKEGTLQLPAASGLHRCADFHVLAQMIRPLLARLGAGSSVHDSSGMTWTQAASATADLLVACREWELYRPTDDVDGRQRALLSSLVSAVMGHCQQTVQQQAHHSDLLAGIRVLGAVLDMEHRALSCDLAAVWRIIMMAAEWEGTDVPQPGGGTAISVCCKMLTSYSELRQLTVMLDSLMNTLSSNGLSASCRAAASPQFIHTLKGCISRMPSGQSSGIVDLVGRWATRVAGNEPLSKDAKRVPGEVLCSCLEAVHVEDTTAAVIASSCTQLIQQGLSSLWQSCKSNYSSGTDLASVDLAFVLRCYLGTLRLHAQCVAIQPHIQPLPGQQTQPDILMTSASSSSSSSSSSGGSCMGFFDALGGTHRDGSGGTDPQAAVYLQEAWLSGMATKDLQPYLKYVILETLLYRTQLLHDHWLHCSHSCPLTVPSNGSMEVHEEQLQQEDGGQGTVSTWHAPLAGYQSEVQQALRQLVAAACYLIPTQEVMQQLRCGRDESCPAVQSGVDNSNIKAGLWQLACCHLHCLLPWVTNEAGTSEAGGLEQQPLGDIVQVLMMAASQQHTRLPSPCCHGHSDTSATDEGNSIVSCSRRALRQNNILEIPGLLSTLPSAFRCLMHHTLRDVMELFLTQEVASPPSKKRHPSSSPASPHLPPPPPALISIIAAIREEKITPTDWMMQHLHSLTAWSASCNDKIVTELVDNAIVMPSKKKRKHSAPGVAKQLGAAQLDALDTLQRLFQLSCQLPLHLLPHLAVHEDRGDPDDQSRSATRSSGVVGLSLVGAVAALAEVLMMIVKQGEQEVGEAARKLCRNIVGGLIALEMALRGPNVDLAAAIDELMGSVFSEWMLGICRLVEHAATLQSSGPWHLLDDLMAVESNISFWMMLHQCTTSKDINTTFERVFKSLRAGPPAFDCILPEMLSVNRVSGADAPSALRGSSDYWWPLVISAAILKAVQKVLTDSVDGPRLAPLKEIYAGPVPAAPSQQLPLASLITCLHTLDRHLPRWLQSLTSSFLSYGTTHTLNTTALRQSSMNEAFGLNTVSHDVFASLDTPSSGTCLPAETCPLEARHEQKTESQGLNSKVGVRALASVHDACGTLLSVHAGLHRISGSCQAPENVTCSGPAQLGEISGHHGDADADVGVPELYHQLGSVTSRFLRLLSLPWQIDFGGASARGGGCRAADLTDAEPAPPILCALMDSLDSASAMMEAGSGDMKAANGVPRYALVMDTATAMRLTRFLDALSAAVHVVQPSISSTDFLILVAVHVKLSGSWLEVQHCPPANWHRGMSYLGVPTTALSPLRSSPIPWHSTPPVAPSDPPAPPSATTSKISLRRSLLHSLHCLISRAPRRLQAHLWESLDKTLCQLLSPTLISQSLGQPLQSLMNLSEDTIPGLVDPRGQVPLQVLCSFLVSDGQQRGCTADNRLGDESLYQQYMTDLRQLVGSDHPLAVGGDIDCWGQLCRIMQSTAAIGLDRLLPYLELLLISLEGIMDHGSLRQLSHRAPCFLDHMTRMMLYVASQGSPTNRDNSLAAMDLNPVTVSILCTALRCMESMIGRENYFKLRPNQVALCMFVGPLLFRESISQAMRGAHFTLRKYPSGSPMAGPKTYGCLFVAAARVVAATIRHRQQDVKRSMAVIVDAARTLLLTLCVWEANQPTSKQQHAHDALCCAEELAKIYSETAANKGVTGQYAVHMLADYITYAVAPMVESGSSSCASGLLHGGLPCTALLSDAVGQTIRQEAYALYGACGHMEVHELYSLLGAGSNGSARRDGLAQLKRDYEKHYKYTGKV